MESVTAALAMKYANYQVRCDRPDCPGAVYKLAAHWSDGSVEELKPYGFACDRCLAEALADAQRRRERLPVADVETVGPVRVFRLERGKRDRELEELKVES